MLFKTQNTSLQFETLWETEFHRLSNQQNAWALVACIVLSPCLLIDYPLVSLKEKEFFILIRLMPSILITLIWIISHLNSINLKYATFWSSFLIILSMNYRPGTDLDNFIILNAVCIILLSLLPLLQLKSMMLLSMTYLLSNILIYYLFYSTEIPIAESGLLIISTFSIPYFIILKFRYNSIKKNFIQSHRLSLQFDKIKEQNKELDELDTDIQNKSQILIETFQDLEDSNQALLDSLDYARDLQQLLLPKEQEIKDHIDDFFILFQPLNRVSGDFYWFTPVQDGFIIVAMDCTGHGVPGALMSMIGEALIKRIIIDQKVTEPRVILNKIHQGIRQTLRQYENNNRDGMEVSLVFIHQAKKKLYFAGAPNPMIYFQNKEMYTLKGDLFSIGSELRNQNFHFTQKEVELQEETVFYLFTDGFENQFGGTEGKKFMRYRFRETLQKIYQLPMEEQKEQILKVLKEWQGHQEQVDDILVMGFRLKK